MSNILAKLAGGQEKKKDTAECLIDGMTYNTYMRYQKKMKEMYNGKATRIQPISTSANR